MRKNIVLSVFYYFFLFCGILFHNFNLRKRPAFSVFKFLWTMMLLLITFCLSLEHILPNAEVNRTFSSITQLAMTIINEKATLFVFIPNCFFLTKSKQFSNTFAIVKKISDATNVTFGFYASCKLIVATLAATTLTIYAYYRSLLLVGTNHISLFRMLVYHYPYAFLQFIMTLHLWYFSCLINFAIKSLDVNDKRTSVDSIHKRFHMVSRNMLDYNLSNQVIFF